MATVVRRPLAALDILDVWDHIADDDMAAADRWVDELDTAFGRLATQPLMGRARPALAPGDEAGGVLLHQAVQRGLLGAVAFIVELSAICRTLGLLRRGLHDGLPVG